MKLKDYYSVLGVVRTASSSDIKKAYIRLIKLYHPDLYPESNYILYKFQEITEAYSILGDLDKRLEYTVKLTNTFNKLDEQMRTKRNGIK